MGWKALVVNATGELKQTLPEEAVPNPLPAGWVSIDIPRQVNGEIEEWNPATRTIVPKDLTPLIVPLVTKTQARDTLKVLLETNPATWTATQERQAMYLILLFAFKDLKNGKVY